MSSPETTTRLHVRAWADPVIDELGFEPTSPYVEWCHLPRLGPSACWIYRRLTRGLVVQPDGYHIDTAELAHWMGLGTGTGRNAPVMRTLNRLVSFHAAAWDGNGTLAVRRRLPPLTQAQLARLHPSVQATHHRLLALRSPGTDSSQAAG